MPVPSNITPATAIDMSSLPFSHTQDVSDAPDGTGFASSCDSAQHKAVWYKYTGSIPNTVIAFRPFANTVGYSAGISIWTGPLGSLVQVTDPYDQEFCGEIGPPGALDYWEIPVGDGETFYIQVVDFDNTSVGTVNLTVTAEPPPNQNIPAGSLAIPDDVSWQQVNFPLAVISPTTGEFVRLPPFPPGELVALTANGEILAQNDTLSAAPDYIASFNIASLYDNQLNFVTSITFAQDIATMAGNEGDSFFVLLGTFGAPILQKVSNTGVLGTTWNLPASTVYIVVDRAETFCYCGVNNGVRKYNLLTNTDLGQIVAPFAGNVLWKEGGTTAAGNFWFLYRVSINARANVRLFSPVGALLFTYDGSAIDETSNRACYWPGDGGADFESIWVWTFDTGSTFKVKLRRIKISDFTVTTLPLVPGMNISGFPSNVFFPDAQFAASNSCPIFALRVAIAAFVPSVPGGGIYFINPNKTEKHDSYYNDIEVKIPDPTVRLALLGE